MMETQTQQHPPDQRQNGHDESEIHLNVPKISKRKLTAVLAAVLLIFVIAFLARVMPDIAHDRDLRTQASAQADAPPVVDVATPLPQAAEEDLVLPADIHPWAQTAIYARVDGFLGKWYFDIGDHVEKGQLLATIDAPDTDAELNQSRAALQQAVANEQRTQTNLELASTTYDRYHGLLATGSVTQQDLDTRQTTMDQATADKAAAVAAIASAKANVAQLEAQQGFEKIIAPFSGTITQRNYDPGARISASDTVAGHQLFDIQDTDLLRVWVNVPQAYITLIQINQFVDFISLRNYGTRRFQGVIGRTAGALDNATRTLPTEVDFNNKDHLLWAGMYGEVHINVHHSHPTLTVPTPAMMFESSGTQLAVVDENKRVHFRKVTVGQDFGQRLEIISGVNEGDLIITNPGEKLVDGGEVQFTAQAAPQPPAPVAAADPPTTRFAQGDADPPGSPASGGAAH